MSAAHPLDPLLAPRAIALVGASARPESAGLALAEMVALDGYAGAVYPVNPNYAEIAGRACFPDLASLPERVEHAVLSVPNASLEAALDQAIQNGVRAVTIFANGQMEGDGRPPLAHRIADKARAAGLALCGVNCMGFYNPSIGLRVASFPSPPGLRRGGIAWIAQSGSAFSALAHNDRRLGFALCVSSGMELVTTLADYMDWALAREATRVIGLFLETVRDPEAFRAALEKAAALGLPVVALKVGRTARSAAMARSHSGALAGDDGAYRALFRRYGVAQVDDLDEMAATLALFDTPRRAAAGAFASVHDSGGERELVADLAEALEVPLAEIADDTRSAIAPHLDPGLDPENPLDAYGTNRDYLERYAACLDALLADPAVALLLFFSNVRDDYWYAAGILEALRRAAARSDKPLALVSNSVLTGDRALALEAAETGIPLIKGSRVGLRAARHALAFRDHRGRLSDPLPVLPEAALDRWRRRLAAGPLDEAEGLQLLAAIGIAIPALRRCASAEAVGQAAGDLRFPLVLKTAEGQAHKSDVGGVVTGIADRAALLAAYAKMAGCLGPRVLVMETAPAGVEIGLGAVVDPAFGPVVVLAAGGLLIELLDDKAVALAPFGPGEARRLLGELKLARLLAGVRGRPAADLDALADTVARFSVLAAALAPGLSEIDVNPVIAGPAGAVAVDCLLLSREETEGHGSRAEQA